MSTQPRTVYCAPAPAGSDTEGCGTQARPFESMQRALAFRRERGWNTNMSAEQFVSFAPGDYYGAVATVTPADSGSNGHNVTYRASGAAGSARFIAGRLVTTAWSLVSPNVYRTPLPDKVWALYVDGNRATLPRLPLLNPTRPCAFAPYFQSAGVDQSLRDLIYDPDDFDPGDGTDLRVFAWPTALPLSQAAWVTDIHGLSALDTTAHKLTLPEDMKYFAENAPFFCRYFVMGQVPMLSGPLQFTCSGGWLYLWSDTDPAALDVVVPISIRGLSFVGDDETTRVSHVRVSGVSIECTDFYSWYREGGTITDDFAFYFPALFQQGAVYLENADAITLDSLRIRNTGFSAVFWQGYVQGCTLRNSLLEQLGSGGVISNGNLPGDGDTTRLNTVYNCKIRHYGQLDGSANGIRLCQASSNVVSHCEITDAPNRGISIQGAFGVAPADNYAYGNVVQYTLIRDTCQDSGDRGGITTTVLSVPAGTTATRPRNRFFQCKVIDTTADPTMTDVPPAGVFSDDESANQEAECVEVTNAQGGQFRYNNSDGWILTNTSFIQNGTPNPLFDPSLMSADIGVTAAFPYA